MNKMELVDKVAEKVGVTKTSVTPIVNAVFQVLAERLYQEDTISIADFGKFGIRNKAARTARNPQTGGTVEVPAKNAVYFKPAKNLKEYVQD